MGLAIRIKTRWYWERAEILETQPDKYVCFDKIQTQFRGKKRQPLKDLFWSNLDSHIGGEKKEKD